MFGLYAYVSCVVFLFTPKLPKTSHTNRPTMKQVSMRFFLYTFLGAQVDSYHRDDDSHVHRGVNETFENIQTKSCWLVHRKCSKTTTINQPSVTHRAGFYRWRFLDCPRVKIVYGSCIFILVRSHWDVIIMCVLQNKTLRVDIHTNNGCWSMNSVVKGLTLMYDFLAY